MYQKHISLPLKRNNTYRDKFYKSEYAHYGQFQLQIINDRLEISIWKLERDIQSIRELLFDEKIYVGNSRNNEKVQNKK
ncbi:MAG UNVERIFIED_CONTAM: hypothetical protein LVQ98_08560 [Rickettsiaceae bacterium]